MNLTSLRKSIRELRRSINEDVRRTANEKIVQSFLRLDSFQKSKSVSGFLAFDGEADPLHLMRLAFEQGKRVYVPTIIERKHPLMFVPWSPGIELRANSFGIAEPVVDRTEWIKPEQLDFVITPLVAFDQHCLRIGVGGGYYDRSFAFLNVQDRAMENRQSENRRSTILAGFAFEMQRVDAIDSQPWDVPLDWVITECGIYRRFGFERTARRS